MATSGGETDGRILAHMMLWTKRGQPMARVAPVARTAAKSHATAHAKCAWSLKAGARLLFANFTYLACIK